MESWGLSDWWRARRGRAQPPPRGERTWVHPSELPSFEKLPTSVWPLRSRAARVTALFMGAALIAGGMGLAVTHNPNAPGANAPPHIVTALSQLPSQVREAADRTVDLTITTPTRIEVAAAMVLPHDLAVTTTPIPANAHITGTMSSRTNFPVTWVGRDQVMNFSIVRLGVHVAPLTFAPMPASTAITAVSPLLAETNRAPLYAWASTTLSDPTIDDTGVISYLATATDSDINGFTNAIAVNQAGDVVAVLSTGHVWYSAQFVARIAYIVATGRGCHSSLGIIGKSAQGGGVEVAGIVPKSPAQWLLKKGDIITAINGKNTETYDALVTQLYLTPAFSAAHVTFDRGDTVRHTVMTLGCAL